MLIAQESAGKDIIPYHWYFINPDFQAHLNSFRPGAAWTRTFPLNFLNPQIPKRGRIPTFESARIVHSKMHMVGRIAMFADFRSTRKPHLYEDQ
jgi:hypothetical protein